jgi:hypothetical protein
MRTRLFLFLSLAGFLWSAEAANTPPPLKLLIPFESAWRGMLETLKDPKDSWILVREDRIKGAILTQYREYSSGTLTEDHIPKIGEKPKLGDAQWLSVEYQYEVEIQLLAAKETLVTVHTNIRAKKRDFLGKEETVKIASNGSREATLLTKFGRLLFGEGFKLDRDKTGVRDFFEGDKPKYSDPNPP